MAARSAFPVTIRDWRRYARCRVEPADPVHTQQFFPERGQSHAPAKGLCDQCFVRPECLKAGMIERFGIWGGESERGRRRLKGRNQGGDRARQWQSVVSPTTRYP